MTRNDSSRPARPKVESIRQLTRARWAILTVFLIFGMSNAAWLARIPSIRDALGMSPSQLGVALLAGAVGALVTVAAAGPFVNRFGGRAAFVTSALMFAVGFTFMGIGPAVGSVPMLAVGIFVMGSSFALGNVPLNVESAGVERRLGRTVLPQFHAAFSIGAVLGSLIGAACAWAGCPSRSSSP
ncbi:hypothetical protein GCM10025865_05300 [Paraoerskovia sediminicola]|uniref:Major facilitator superfamily (MFS) profile domain-containing protein n=1 Tax=Paraoerskovia sediminicola TaxID=1138587 RepID=A0ABM8FZS3_9CELL|nr:MFS transporter [Paraoerskovia sediminicola]BDZ41231.1 hypothetical protein GCM10025865_05300 [Paraoerskovia sediminicola]